MDSFKNEEYFSQRKVLQYSSMARKKKAAVAIGHQILKDVYHILSTGKPYTEIGAEAARNRRSEARERSIIRELDNLDYSVQKVEASA